MTLRKRIRLLREIAGELKERDPLGATVLRSTANLLENQSCANCADEYRRGYQAGYNRPYRADERTARREGEIEPL